MNKARRHHTVPQFYLRGFADPDERVLQIDADTGRSDRRTVAKVAVRIHAYRSDQLNVDAETELSEQENHFAPVHSSFGQRWPPALRERRTIARSMLLQLTRDPDRKTEQVSRARDAMPDAWDEDRTDQDVFLLANGILLMDPDDPDQRRQLEDHDWLDDIEQALASFCDRAWTLLTIPSGTLEFITSDSPVVPIRAGPAPPSASGVPGVSAHSNAHQILFPIDRRTLLIAGTGAPQDDSRRHPPGARGLALERSNHALGQAVRVRAP